MTAPTYNPLPDPTPGATAWLMAVNTVPTPHGPHTTTSIHQWDGYTAADLRTHWAARAKAARWDHQWSGGVLTVHRLRGITITRTFYDEEPAA